MAKPSSPASRKRKAPPKRKPARRKAAPTRRTRRSSAPHRAPKAAPVAPPLTHSRWELPDDAVERALLTGEHPGVLEDYFGPDGYAELRSLAREAAAAAVRGGPRVLILPGIMGSKLGRRRGPLEDAFWFDPVDIAVGRLADLALPSRGAIGPLGVLLFTYLRLKLRLKRAGYDAAFHPFDWRTSLDGLGRELAARIAREGGPDVSLVAHSMGGLVARAALGQGAACRRLIMLGTPNFGSYAPVMAVRGVYPSVRKVAALDLRHSAEWLAEHVFATFAGLIQMIAFPDRDAALDLYDLATWPQDALRPSKNLLREARAVQARLAAGDDRCVLIAGVNQETVTGVSREGGANGPRRGRGAGGRAGSGFVYRYAHDGDGTVPVELARLPGVATYYVEEKHGSLPNNRLVARAVCEILSSGETGLLPQAWTADASPRAARLVPEADLRVEPFEGRRGGQLSQRELRHVVDDVAAPDATEMVVPVPETAAPPETGYAHAFERIVVGRRRQHRLDLRFALGSVTEADTRALALGIFRDVTPGGAARALDERMGGAITELSRRRMFAGQVGEVFLMPTGRHDLRADLIAFVGLGAYDRFTEETLAAAAENLLRFLVTSRVEEFATVLFGGGSGEGAARLLRGLLTGFVRGLRDADADHRFRRVVICEIDPQRYLELKEELFRLSSTPLLADVEITFDEAELPPAPVSAGGATRRAREDPVYLIARQEGSATGARGFDVRSSLLTAGSKATVITGSRRVAERDLRQLLARLENQEAADLRTIGLALSDLLLAEEVRAVLTTQRQRHLVVVHDEPLSRVPWETIALPASGAERAWHPAAERGLSRRYAADNLSVAKWLEERVQDETLAVLLVVDPTQDLPGAVAEGQRLRKLLARRPGVRLTELWQDAATRPALLSALGSGRYDVVHYAGHAFFDAASPERGGLLCHGEVPLTGADLAGLARLPALVCFNACESARVRRGRAPRGEPRAATRGKQALRQRLERSVGFAEAFLRGGIASFIGTYWPVGDEAAEAFAQAFYQELLGGRSAGEALQAGRTAVRRQGTKDWADYIHYGSPAFVLKEGRAGR